MFHQVCTSLFAFIILAQGLPTPPHEDHPLPLPLPHEMPFIVATGFIPKIASDEFSPKDEELVSIPMPVVPRYPLLLSPYMSLGSHTPEESISSEKWEALRQAALAAGPSPSRGVLQNLFAAFADAYQEIINRQQAFLDMLYCKNCNTGTSSPWLNFLNAMANIPTLGWIMRPSSYVNGTHPSGSFVAATNQNGVVSGVGGSIVNNQPIVEYTFNNNHVKPVKPTHASQLSSHQKIVLTNKNITETYNGTLTETSPISVTVDNSKMKLFTNSTKKLGNSGELINIEKVVADGPTHVPKEEIKNFEDSHVLPTTMAPAVS